jgi:hypothetical protein
VRKEAVRDDFMIGLRIAVLPELTNDEQCDVVATRRAFVEVDRVKLRRGSELDVALFGQLARKGFEKRLARLNAPARQMPAIDVGMLDQKNPAVSVNDNRANAQSRRTREPPIEVHDPPDDGLERSAQTIQGHGSSLVHRSF